MTYIPNDKQVEAHCAVEQFLGYGGAMGGGKTRWLCEMAKLLSIRFPGNLGLLARQSGPALRLSTQEVFFSEVLIPSRAKNSEWMKLGCKFNKAEGILEFKANGSRIWFTGLDSDNVERVKSLNLGFFGIDEATEAAESMFMMLATRLRRAGIPKQFRKAMISANPEAGWVKRRFVDQDLPNHKFVEANYKDNPFLPDDYPQLFDTLPLIWRQKYLDGNWGAVSGLIYQDFDPEFHVIPYAPFPPEWRQIRGMDHGQQNPTACLGMGIGYADQHLEMLIGAERMEQLDKRFDSYPVIIVQKMYYSPGLVSDHRREIAALWPHFKGPTFGDPSMWKKDREKMLSDGKRVEYSIANEYGETPHPLRGLVRANNIVDVGINRTAQLMRIGHLFFMEHPSMEELIGLTGEVRSYSWKQPRTDDDDWPEVPDKKRDHGVDGLRYGIMSLPPLKVEAATVIPYNSFAAAKMRAEAHKRGGKQLMISGGKVIGI